MGRYHFFFNYEEIILREGPIRIGETFTFIFARNNLSKTFEGKYMLKYAKTTKEIVERRHGEPIRFLFLRKMGLLGSQASNEKNFGYEL